MNNLRLLAFCVLGLLASREQAIAACVPVPEDPAVTVCDTRADFYRALAAAGITVGLETLNEPERFAEGNHSFNSQAVNLSGDLTNTVALVDGYFRAEAFRRFQIDILFKLPNSHALGFDFDYVGPAAHVEIAIVGRGSVYVSQGFIGIISKAVFNQFRVTTTGLPPDLTANMHVLRLDNLEFDSTLPNIPVPPSTPTNPQPPGPCPVGADPSAICFPTPPQPSWYDPAPTNGYRFTAFDGRFLAIEDFPPGFDAAFDVNVGGTHFGPFGPGQRVDFPGGVTEFTITGIRPTVDGSNPLAFPIKLSLDTVGSTFAMVPLGESAVDVTPPQVSCNGSDGLWHGADVTVACTASDEGSGLANAADASFLLSTSVPSGTAVDGAVTGQRSVCDAAGNCVNAGPVGGHRVDKKTPTVAINAPSAVTYTLGQSIVASYACTDPDSGVAACSGPVSNGATVDTTSVGTKTFTVNARDNVGNTSHSTVSYTVVGPKRVSGSGYNSPEVAAYRATVMLDVTGAATPFGSVHYAYSRTRLTFVSTSISSFALNGSVVTIQGAGTVNGVAGFTFVVTATNGAPDAFGIVIRRTDGSLYYSAASLALAGGDFSIQQ